MRKYLIVAVLVSTIVLKVNGFSGDYESIIIISAIWGQADGEFGLMLEAEGNCPQSLSIDEKGNLAILDAVNKRVQLYNSDGKWIGKFAISLNAFEIWSETEHFVLLAPYDYLIEQYDREGRLINKVNIDPKIEFIDGLRVAANNIFAQTIEQVQYNVTEKSQTKQLESVTQGLISQIPDLRFQTRWIDAKQGHLLIENNKTGKEQKIKITTQDELGSLVFLDTDKYGNIYLRKELFTPYGKSYFEVDKLDRNGNVLSTIHISNENIVAPFKPITVDREGNIYFLESKSEGFSVIRWEAKK